MIAEFLERVEGVVGQAPRPVALHEPFIGDAEESRVLDAVRSGWVSSVGPMVGDFEEALSRVTGAPHVGAVSTGTAALHLALLEVGVGPGDEVVVPDITFIATANAVAYCGATPLLVDVEEEWLSLDTDLLARRWDELFRARDGGWENRATGARLGAVVVVHALGHVAPPDALVSLCRERGVPLVEDAAEALGSRYGGRHAGSWGQVGVLSFNGNKIVTTGGGGAVLTSDEASHEHMRHLATTARRPHPWAYHHDEVGYNYRMPSVLAAVGLGQLESLDAFVEAKRALAADYREALDGWRGLRLVEEAPGARSNYWLNAAVLPDGAGDGALAETLDAALERGLHLRPLWEPLHRQAAFRDVPTLLEGRSRDLARRVLCLPSSAGLRMS